jgi:hypothetical protein
MKSLLSLSIFGFYLAISVIFITGYHYTTFRRKILSKLIFSLFWPILLITYPRFRRNFQRALERDRLL